MAEGHRDSASTVASAFSLVSKDNYYKHDGEEYSLVPTFIRR